MLFPTGCDRWHLGLKKTDNKTLTAADFYKSRLQIRNNDFNIMFRVKKLAQQYAVDKWANIEAVRLDWVRRNQKSLRAEKYQGLMDAVHAGDHNDVGVKIILPSTIYGSPRFYSEAFQDTMAIVRHLGKRTSLLPSPATQSGLKSQQLSILGNKLATVQTYHPEFSS